MNNETKVGMLVVACVIGLLGLSALMGNIHLFGKNGINVTFELSNAAGLVPKSVVKYRGIDVGKVKSVKLISGKVLVDTVLDPDSLIPNNVTVVLAQDGIMGNKFIDLVSKSNVSPTGFLKNGDIYSNYSDPVSLEDIMGTISVVADDIKTLVSSLNEVFSSDEGKHNMKMILDNLAKGSESLKNILVTNEAKVSDIVNHLDSFTTKLDDLLSVQNRDNLNISIQNLKDITTDIKVTVANLNTITDNITSSRGTLGMLINDNQTKEQVKDAVATLNNMLEKSNRLQIYLDAGFEYLPSPDKYRGTFTAKIIPSDERYYLLGVSNIPSYTTSKKTTYSIYDHNTDSFRSYTENEDITKDNTFGLSLQYALMFNERMFTLRGGLFENKLGFGADYYPFEDRALMFTVEASDFDRKRLGTRVKANAQYRFWDHFFIQSGWDNIGTRDNSFTIGAGIYFEDRDLKYVIGSLPTSSLGQ